MRRISGEHTGVQTRITRGVSGVDWNRGGRISLIIIDRRDLHWSNLCFC